MTPRFGRFAWPVITTAVALAVRFLVDPLLGAQIPYATFYVAVALSSILGGAVSGLIATLLGAAASAYFLLPPRHTLLVTGTENQVGLAVYFVVSGLLVLLGNLQRAANSRLAQSEASER